MKKFLSLVLAVMLLASVTAFADFYRVRVGDYITFGSYEQDGNYKNGQEPVEWLVLDVDEYNGAALLISRYGLDVMPYNMNLQDVTWENSYLRSWLNGTFLNDAFSSNEQNLIFTSKNKAENNPQYATNGGYDTYDEVFLLSVTFDNLENVSFNCFEDNEKLLNALLNALLKEIDVR